MVKKSQVIILGVILSATLWGSASAAGKSVTAADFDTYNLRYDADFEVQIDKDVYWVPANALGKSKYDNSAIAQLAKKSPEEKQKQITNLYEALQLFQISDFKASRDNVRIAENGVNWEHHKPGYHAVRTNEGCCASNSSWLNYILKNDYDELGFVSYSYSNGNGHVFNYIKKDGFYYVIDLTRYETESGNSMVVETGDRENFDFSGCIIKVKSLSDYALQYFPRQSNPPGLFTSYAADLVIPVDSIPKDADMVITIPKGSKVTVLFDNKYDNMDLSYAPPPTQKVDWSVIPSAVINPVIPDIYRGELIVNPDSGHKYRIFNLEKTWEEAQAYCKSAGGYLLTITTESEYDFVMKHLADRDMFNGAYWIGGFEEGHSGNWRWVTGEEFGFENWRAGDPGNTDLLQKSCLEMGKTGFWYSRPADKKSRYLHFICEWDK